MPQVCQLVLTALEQVGEAQMPADFPCLSEVPPSGWQAECSVNTDALCGILLGIMASVTLRFKLRMGMYFWKVPPCSAQVLVQPCQIEYKA